jgi:hypothetical protein
MDWSGAELLHPARREVYDVGEMGGMGGSREEDYIKGLLGPSYAIALSLGCDRKLRGNILVRRSYLLGTL